MQHLKTRLLTFLFTALSFGLFSQNAIRSMNLEDCISYAVGNNTQVEKARLEVEKANHRITEVRSTALPQVNADVDFRWNAQLPTQLLPGDFFGSPGELVPVRFGTKLNTGVGLRLSQAIYDKRYSIGLEGAQKVVELNGVLHTKSKESIAFEVGKIYYQALVTKKQEDILTANLRQIERLSSLTKAQYENGFAKKIDVDRLGVTKINLETQIENLQLQYEQLLDIMKNLMSMSLEQDIVLTDTIIDKEYQLPTAIIIKPDFSNKTEMHLLALQDRLNQINVEQFKAGYYPSVHLMGGYGQQAQGDDLDQVFKSDFWFGSAYLGLKVRVPIFDGFAKKSRISQAEVQMQQWKQDKTTTELALNLQYRQARQQLQLNFNNLQSLAQNSAVAEEVYRLSQKRFSEGVANITELLSAETVMRETQTNYLTTLLRIKLSELELLNAKGEILTLIK